MKKKGMVLLTICALALTGFFGFEIAKANKEIAASKKSDQAMKREITNLETALKQKDADLTTNKATTDSLAKENESLKTATTDSSKQETAETSEVVNATAENAQAVNVEPAASVEATPAETPAAAAAETVAETPVQAETPAAAAATEDPNWGEKFSDPNLTGADRAQLGKEKGEYYRNKYGQ